MNNLYTCCGLGSEYVGTSADYAEYFNANNFQILSQKGQSPNSNEIVFMLETEGGNVFDVSLMKVNHISNKSVE